MRIKLFCIFLLLIVPMQIQAATLTEHQINVLNAYFQTAYTTFGTDLDNLLSGVFDNAVTSVESITFDSSTGIYHTSVELTNAQIKALRATPKVLVAAPGAGYFIEFVSAVLILNYGSNVLTESVDNLVIEYTTGGQDVTAAIEATGFIDAAVDTIAIIPAATVATDAAADIVNKSLQLFNTGDGEYAGNAGNDTTMTVKVAYRVHASGL